MKIFIGQQPPGAYCSGQTQTTSTFLSKHLLKHRHMYFFHLLALSFSCFHSFLSLCRWLHEEVFLLRDNGKKTHLISWTRRCILAIAQHKERGRFGSVMCFCVCLAGCCSLDFRKAFYRGEWKQEQWKTGCTPHVEPFPVVLQTGTIAAAVSHLAVMQKLHPSANGFWVVLVCAICSSSCILFFLWVYFYFFGILVTIVEMPECIL